MMSDQTDYVDPASTWPAGVPHDAALRQLEGRIRALEEGEDRPETGDAPVARPSTFGASDQERADFEAWLAAGRPLAGERERERVTTSTTPGLVGFPAGTPAAEPATGAGPEGGPVTSAGNPDYPDATREGDARPGQKSEPATGAGPEGGPVTSAGNPDYPDATREGDARPGQKSTGRKVGQ